VFTLTSSHAKKQFDFYIKVLEYVSYFLGGKKCQKIVNIGVMRMDRAAQQIVQRNLSMHMDTNISL
jgi:hypothetical protein